MDIHESYTNDTVPPEDLPFYKTPYKTSETKNSYFNTTRFLWVIFWVVFLLFLAIFAATTSTVKMSLDNPIAHQNNAVMGTWDSTGAAILLVGIPYLFLYVIDLYSRK